jgi:hypothetical protein
MWVAEWLSIAASRRSRSTSSVTRELKLACLALQELAKMDNRAIGLARIAYFYQRTARGSNRPTVTGLAAPFRIEGRLGDDDLGLAVSADAAGENLGLGLVTVVADKT